MTIRFFGNCSNEELVDRWRALRRERTDGSSRWMLLIMELRVEHGASILEAERIALSNRHRRRWVEKQINTRERCRKYVLSHIRHNGDARLIERDGGSLRIRLLAR